MTIDDIHGWFDYLDIYREAIRLCPTDGTLVELGVWCGKSLAFLATEAMAKNRYDIQIIGIDLWECSMPLKEVCEHNLSRLGLRNRVRLVQSDTIAAAEQFSDGSVDFVWFDSDHNPQHVGREICAWLPKLKRPSWCGGHDVGTPGLMQVVKSHLPWASGHQQNLSSWTAEVR